MYKVITWYGDSNSRDSVVYFKTLEDVINYRLGDGKYCYDFDVFEIKNVWDGGKFDKYIESKLEELTKPLV